MDESDPSSNKNKSILVSRNSPVALIVGVASFIGSHVAEKLLSQGIQVIGLDEISQTNKINLVSAIKDNKFHLINKHITEISHLEVARIDYSFFISDQRPSKLFFSKGLSNYIKIIREFKTKNVFISSIELYDNKLSDQLKQLKAAEIHLAKHSRYYKLNTRIIRLAPVFGPRMNFEDFDPVTKLIQATLLNQLVKEQASLEFVSRDLYIDDAVRLITKAALSGSTAQKIYDGVNPNPIKVSEVKQILLDPLWHELKGFKPTPLPPWSTPNLKRTVSELSWQPKVGIINALRNTISYFKDNEIDIPKFDEDIWDKNVKRWSFTNPEIYDQEKEISQADNAKTTEENKTNRNQNNFQNRSTLAVVALIIFLGLFLPIVQLVYGVFNIRHHLKTAGQYIIQGNFPKAEQEINSAKQTISGSKRIFNSLAVLKRIGVFKDQISSAEQIIDLVGEGIDGVDRSTSGTKALYQATKIISGESRDDPGKLYKTAQAELSSAELKIAKVRSELSSVNLSQNLPFNTRGRVEDLKSKLNFYADLVEKARVASFLLPQITAIGEKKSYLILFQNNLELRAAGGFISTYGKITFENGRIVEIKVDDIYNIDRELKEIIEPPPDFKSDMGINKLFLQDSNFEPDYPTSAREAEFLYKKESTETVNGVIALDLSGSAKLLEAVGGLELAEFGGYVNGNNLLEQAIVHAAQANFPPEQQKKSYLTSLQTQLFNKLFYLSNQNWPAIIAAVSESLEQKHLMIYLSDQQILSYLTTENWAGILPRGVVTPQGEALDFLAAVESNMGANNANYYLERKYQLDTQIDKDGGVTHKLTIHYKNNSPSDAFPAGVYKNRFKIYVPLGSRLTKVIFGEADITGKFSTFSDYGRTGYSTLLLLYPKEQKNLVLTYNLPKPLQFNEEKVYYRLDVIKQAGTNSDSFDWNLTFPKNYSAESFQPSKNAPQEINISTDLQRDRSFAVNFAQK